MSRHIGGIMRVGSLVKVRHRGSRKAKIGLITFIDNEIAKLVWANGEKGAIHTKWLEVLCK